MLKKIEYNYKKLKNNIKIIFTCLKYSKNQKKNQKCIIPDVH